MSVIITRQFSVVVVVAALLSVWAISSVDAARRDFVAVLENIGIDEKLLLVQPVSLIQRGVEQSDLTTQYINQTCLRDFRHYEKALARRESWAIRMLDASSKDMSGLLKGNVMDIGMYDECVEVDSGVDVNGLRIQGRHCMYFVEPIQMGDVRFPLEPRMSICVPATCGADDVVAILNGTISASDDLRNLGVMINSASCSGMSTVKKSDTELIAVLVLGAVYVGFLLLCTLCGCLYDSQAPEEQQPGLLQTLAKFSYVTNGKALLSTEQKSNDFAFIHGLRFISSAWVVLVHEYLFVLLAPINNLTDLSDWFPSWKSLVCFVGIYNVDTFFTLSGFLMTYSVMKKLQKNQAFNVPMYYLHRFIRLTPPVLVALVAAVVIFPRIHSGAIMDWLQTIFMSHCREKWWAIVFYVQNFVDPNNFCLLHLWSNCVDMQLFWISPLILYPLYKMPKLGLLIIAALFSISTGLVAAVIGLNNYSIIHVSHEPNIAFILESFKDLYIPTYTRATPWLLGILLGYEVATNNWKPGKLTFITGWLMAIFSFGYVIVGTRTLTDANYNYDVVWEMTFAAMARPLWGFAICWIIYACIHNAAGIVCKFLSCRYFLPLSRLSYSIYIIHVLVPFLRLGLARTNVNFNDLVIFHNYLGDMAVVIFVAFFFSLTFEVPILVLEDMIFSTKTKSHRSIEEKKAEEAASSEKNSEKS
ncbi:hypothetical protein TKK_0019292 [Trichogramma kaykai]|uniref:Nose resistant-to-fluoxetine protein N-terminal domain-containing protein n=1 Tax=Trichogramma kaykai TaxID=54128 RepID=A0ABD2VT15_9HYME